MWGQEPLPTDQPRPGNLSERKSETIADQSATEVSLPPLTFFSGNTENSSDGVDPEKPIVLTAGHNTLRWQPHPTASGYRIVDQTERIHYEGRMAVGFVSGLVDGDYVFTAVALDEQAEPIGESQSPVHVTVKHHSLAMTWVIFSIGAGVMVCLFAVIVLGIGRREGL